MAETYGNFYLNLEQMTGNAQIILDILTQIYGWKKNGVCGMLGNMGGNTSGGESTINPGICEGLSTYPINNLFEQGVRVGFGLVQWTPYSNYTLWARSNGYSTYDTLGRIQPQIERINYELENGLQWIATSQYPMTFREFIESDESPEYLARVFIHNYERPLDTDQPARWANARYWYDTLEGGVIPTPTTKHKKIWMYLFP